MYKLLLTILAGVWFAGCSKDNNAAGGNGSTNDTTGTVYAAGYRYNGTSLKSIATYWRGNTPVDLTDGTKDAVATGIILQGNDVYVCGYESTGTNTAMAKYWKNGTVVNLTDGTRQTSTGTMTVVGTDVYVSGTEYNAAGKSVAKYWKNGVAVNLTNGALSASATGITLSGADVYAVGYEASASTADLAKYWKNGTAVTLSDGVSNYYGNGIAVNGADIHVVGNIFALAITGPAYWKNGVKSGFTSTDFGESNSVMVNNGDVYIGGSISGKAMYWKNGVAVALSNNSSTYEYVKSVFVFGGKVYCGGYRDFFGSGSLTATIWSYGSSVQLNPGSNSVVNSIYVVN